MLAGAATIALAGCKNARQAGGEVSRNWVPAQPQEYMGVPAVDVQTAITRRLAAEPPEPLGADAWKHVRRLYTTFDRRLLWLSDRGVHQPRVSALLRGLADADSDALRLDDYPLAELSEALAVVGRKRPTAEQLADADVLLTSSFVALGEQLLTGQDKPENFAQSWHINPLEERVDSALVLTLREDDFAAGLARMHPQDPGYDALRGALARYRQLVANGGWRPVPTGRALKRGDTTSAARLDALRARLSAEGYQVESATRPEVYDEQLAGAVADFQQHHSIAVDSVLGGETLEALNVPAEYRTAQIAANLERYRWLPRSLGSRYVLVNVPAFTLTAYDDEQAPLEMKVIVGKDYENRATPVFSDSMEYVIFRPYWNVPPTIAANEVFPKEAAHPGYLASQDMEIYNDHGRRAVRQRPGPTNALGLVKFMFPNDFNIYLHDTPQRDLFDKDVRAFSHGCIRVAKPAELAEWALGWPADRVQAELHGSDNHRVNLPYKIPVYIVYFTTFVRDGDLHFGNDLYDRDDALVERLTRSPVQTQATREAQRRLRAMAEGE